MKRGGRTVQSSMRYSEHPEIKPLPDPGGAKAKARPDIMSVGFKCGNVKRTSLPKGGRLMRSK